ncbi:prenyltransferase/squalene oxidase repeat-containing protein [Goodfellowiella coeruleoviolacea]|uniref:Lanosterol synthase n=1 Tax=Goodfellowiella coeruleoviolacea TaxID=334858 RepID=A0AAE3GKX7_9PSEU|nr:prenyltransferase/squalene oxidase repeat-containing protein [Goodfellowiella coeruleoviolacea]MCP2169164.1 lanosterol synthase [Goodfellowiella coeruleoviolacea]
MTALQTSSPLDDLCALQHDDGRWEAEMVWSAGLLAHYVIARRVAGPWPMDADDVRGTLRQFEVTRLPDGAWPVHLEGEGSTSGTVLAYVALRVLGVPPDDELVARARRWLHARPNAVLHMPSMARVWLAVLGLYEYEGIAPITPELLLAPTWFPLHPHRFSCHVRQAYAGMSQLYGAKVRFDLGELTEPLRAELYDRPYRSIDFRAARFRLDAPEVCAPPSAAVSFAYRLLSLYERRPIPALRRAALRRSVALTEADRMASGGQGLTVLHGLLGHLGHASSAPPTAELHRRILAFDVWRWHDDQEGLRFTGARSSSWDTAFALRACAAAPSTPAARAAVAKAHRWLLRQQVTEELPSSENTGRDPVLGGWCFSDAAHRWPVADCTAEALSALLVVRERADLRAVTEPVPVRALVAGVKFILSRQNRDGGFATYERARMPRVFERLNMTETYVDCMSDHSYVECTGSCIAALARFRRACPSVHARVIDAAIRRGVAYLKSQQRPDGSYRGEWGITFTYGTFFALEGLVTAGVSRSDPAIARAVSWLLATQRRDGGWSEHHSSMLSGVHTELPEAHAAMTAWAVLALLAGGLPDDHPAVQRGRDRLLALRADHDGRGWPKQAANGAFYGSGVLDYRLYKDVFPTWALGAHSAEARA